MLKNCAIRIAGLVLSLLALTASALAQLPRTFTDAANVPLLPDDGCVDDTNGTGGGGIIRQLVVRAAGTITDVDLGFQMTHTWRSDIQAGLTYYPFSGPAIGPVVLANDHDESGDNYFATFDSDEVLFSDCSLVSDCGNASNCTSAPGPHCHPDQSIEAFEGACTPGTFTLTVCDRAGSDLGTLGQWSVIVNGLELTFDVDANGVVDVLTDGLLVLRYFFGFRGATLINGAVAGNCVRCTAPFIEAYLASL